MAFQTPQSSSAWWKRWWPIRDATPKMAPRPASVGTCLLLLVATCVLPPALGVAWLIVEYHHDGRAVLIDSKGRFEMSGRRD